MAPSLVAQRSNGLFIRGCEWHDDGNLWFLVRHGGCEWEWRVERRHLGRIAGERRHSLFRRGAVDRKLRRNRNFHGQQFGHDERSRRDRRQRRAGSHVRSVPVRAADVLLQDRGR
jgi:hypothetical protein